ncbi:MAG: hypothetical protein ACFFBD_15665 [Candidatus Hodarchaeota archaeon]
MVYRVEWTDQFSKSRIHIEYRCQVFPNIKGTPQNWMTQLRMVVRIIDRADIETSKQVETILRKEGIGLKHSWVEHLLKLGQKLQVLRRTEEGKYKTNPDYFFMLKEPKKMTKEEKQESLNVILAIPQCKAVLEIITI